MKDLPFSGPEWKIPGYTGYVQGLAETYQKTPVMSQLETKDPEPSSLLYTRGQVPHKKTHSSVIRDPCNDPESFRKDGPGNLWPKLQTTAIQPSAKSPMSSIALGDSRIDTFRTSYGNTYSSPFPAAARLRSPNRNEDLSKTTAALKDIYRSSYNRVGEKRLEKMISTMRERMDAKCGNSNNNAFRLRKLFLAYDEHQSGLVHVEDLRQMCESFGMQLDDDSLLALFHVFDPEGTGYLAYMDLAKHLMQPDTFCYYLGYIDNSQNAAEMERTHRLLAMIHKRILPVIGELDSVLAAFDASGTGYLSKQDLLAGCASLGVVLKEHELQTLMPLLEHDEAGQVNYHSFVKVMQGGDASAEGGAA